MAGEATFQMVTNVGVEQVPPSRQGSAQMVTNVGVEPPVTQIQTFPSQGWGVPGGPKMLTVYTEAAKGTSQMVTNVQ